MVTFPYCFQSCIHCSYQVFLEEGEKNKRFEVEIDVQGQGNRDFGGFGKLLSMC